MYRLILKSNTSETTVELTATEYKILVLAAPLCFLREAICRPPKHPKEITITTERIREETHAFLAKLEDGKLLYKYEFNLPEEHFLLPGWQTGPRSPIRMPGEPDSVFVVDAGVGYCTLERLKNDPITGRGKWAGITDIRDLSVLQTDGQGPIYIRRKLVAKHLEQKIADVRSWATGQSGMIRVWKAQV